MDADDYQETNFRIWFCAYPILFGLAYSQSVVFTSNQNTKLIMGLAYAGYRDVASDWMAHVADPFPVFSELLRWQYEIFGLHFGIHLGFFLVLIVYAFSAVWLVNYLTRHEDSRLGVVFLFSLMWMFIHFSRVRPHWLSYFPDGLAGQYVLNNYYQPCVIGVFLLAGIAAYLSKRLILAATCLVITALIHPTYLMSSAVIALGIVFLPANRHLDINWPQRFTFLSIVFFILGPFAFWTVSQLSSGDPAITERAHALLAEFRIPHHALLSEWNLRMTLTLLIVGLIAAFMDRKGLIGQLLFVLLLFVGVTLVWALAAYSPSLGVAAPWRISAILAPLSWVIILAFLAKMLERMVRTQQLLSFSNVYKISIVCALVASAIGITDLAKKYQRKKGEDFYAISRFLENYHEKGYQYLVPTLQEHISLEAGVPVYVTWKTHPTRDTEFLDWYQRLETAQSVYNREVDSVKIQRLLESNSLTHIIWPTGNGAYPYAQSGQQIFNDEYYSLWDMR